MKKKLLFIIGVCASMVLIACGSNNVNITEKTTLTETEVTTSEIAKITETSQSTEATESYSYSPKYSSSGESSNKHTCEAGSCYKNGTESIIGISGNVEYYCYDHYKEMEDTINYMYDDVYGSDNSTSYNNDSYSNSDSDYKDDIDYIADVYGLSPEEVEQKINAVVDEINGKY